VRNRILLIGLVIVAWISFKVIDYIVPWPVLLSLLFLTIGIMIMHSLTLLFAQTRWRKAKANFSKLESINDKKQKSTDWQPWVDILVPAKNEASVIENTVTNLFKIDYERFSLWIIDDASDDQTPQILKSLQEKYPRLNVLNRTPGSKPGKSAALNEVLPLTRGEVVLVFDADAYVEPNFLNIVLPLLQPESVGAVQVQKQIYAHQKGFLVNCQASEYALDTYFQMGRNLIGGAVELRGNGQLIKRAALIDVGGWNNAAITDDLDMTMRLLVSKWDIKFCTDTCVYEEGVVTLSALMKQRRRWAEGSIRRYLDYIFPLHSPTRLSFVERVDILAFFSQFAIPALMALEIIGELLSLLTGGQTHGKALIVVASAVLLISMLNFFIAIRLYRKKSIWESMRQAIVVNLYVYAHWLPCVLFSFAQIMLRRKASKWHRTTHLGDSV
jgi:1,2-diacylglycerol 3-beta-glucosyltransferase